MSDPAIQIYDVNIDAMRDATQDDIDLMATTIADLAQFREAVHKDVAAGIAGPFVRQAIRENAERRTKRGWVLGWTGEDLKEIGELT